MDVSPQGAVRVGESLPGVPPVQRGGLTAAPPLPQSSGDHEHERGEGMPAQHRAEGQALPAAAVHVHCRAGALPGERPRQDPADFQHWTGASPSGLTGGVSRGSLISQQHMRVSSGRGCGYRPSHDLGPAGFPPPAGSQAGVPGGAVRAGG